MLIPKKFYKVLGSSCLPVSVAADLNFHYRVPGIDYKAWWRKFNWKSSSHSSFLISNPCHLCCSSVVWINISMCIGTNIHINFLLHKKLSSLIRIFEDLRIIILPKIIAFKSHPCLPLWLFVCILVTTLRYLFA